MLDSDFQSYLPVPVTTEVSGKASFCFQSVSICSNCPVVSHHYTKIQRPRTCSVHLVKICYTCYFCKVIKNSRGRPSCLCCSRELLSTLLKLKWIKITKPCTVPRMHSKELLIREKLACLILSAVKGSNSIVSGSRFVKLSVLISEGNEKWKQSILNLFYHSSQ